jgi:predicted phosphodiesterase
VITGDLIDTANPDDWVTVRDALQRHGLFDWQKVTVVPGNHDLINLEEEMRFYNALNPVIKDRQKRLRQKIRIFCELFQPLITGDPERRASLPFVKVLNFGDIKLAFVAVNTVQPWSGSDNPLGARGSIDREDLGMLVEKPVTDALSNSFVIGICHHAYRVYGTDALIDQAFDWTMEFKKILKAKMVLHGHFHRFQAYTVGEIAFFNGGSFKFSPGRYSEVEISDDGRWNQRFIVLP